MKRRSGLPWSQIERRERPLGAFPCDYGHNHLTREAKRCCEDRNDNRGAPPAARFRK